MTLRRGHKGQDVLDLQLALQRLGYPLSRYGADGDLGQETLDALNSFLKDYTVEKIRMDDEVTPEELRLVIKSSQLIDQQPMLPPQYVNALAHPIPRAELAKRRSWQNVKSIVLHQTACVLGERPERWHSIPIHLGITRTGKVLHLNDFLWNLPHANGFNGTSIGIEIDGSFAGVEGNPKTWWAGAGLTSPMTVTDVQIRNTRACLVWICEVVALAGGKIEKIFAHRQSSSQRQSDPGSKVWQEIGLWAKQHLQLSDGGENYFIGDGRPIPQEWDPQRSAKY